MERENLEAMMHREPFVPFCLCLSDRRIFDVPFSNVIVFRSKEIIFFRGVKQPGVVVARSYEVIPYERITAVSKRPPWLELRDFMRRLVQKIKPRTCT